jgi:hypothetical protein
MGIVVHFAVFGAAPKQYNLTKPAYWDSNHNYPSGTVDVMVTVAQMLGNGITSFKADCTNFNDVSPGDTKHFAMLYTVDRGSGPVTYTFACEEGQMVVFPTDVSHNFPDTMGHYPFENEENKIEVRYAVYGAVQGSKDVTAIVKSLVEKGTMSITPSNALFGDPAPGHGKHFGILYSAEGVAPCIACKENQTVDLARPVR